MGSRSHKQEIACQQVLVEDSSVFSIQWSVFPDALASVLTPRLLLERYLAYIKATTIRIITPTTTPDGIEFRLLTSGISLISFLQPSEEPDAITLRICGGLLVQRDQCHRGELRFSVARQPDGVRVTMQLSDYCPLILGSENPSRLRRWLYRLTQAAIHRLVTVRFLALLYRDLAGSSCHVRIVNVHVREGHPT